MAIFVCWKALQNNLIFQKTNKGGSSLISTDWNLFCNISIATKKHWPLASTPTPPQSAGFAEVSLKYI